MTDITDSDDLPTKTADWLLDKVTAAAKGGAGKLFNMALGLYLSTLGFGDDTSPEAKQLQQVKDSLDEIKKQLDAIRSGLTQLESEARLAQAQVLERIENRALSEPRVAIEDAYDDLLDHLARDASGDTAWIDAMARQWYFGTQGLQHQLHRVHEGVVGTEAVPGSRDGLLQSYAALLVESLRQQPAVAGALMAAYRALECRFADIVSLQAKGAFLMVVALNWRDHCAAEQRAGRRPVNPEALVSNFPGHADDYLSSDFRPRLLRQVDLFLRCVDRLVLVRCRPGTRLVAPYKALPRSSTAEFTMTQRALLDPDTAAVYARADCLAGGACPEVHGHMAILRLVGDPRGVKQEASAPAGSKGQPRADACGLSPWHKPDGTPVLTAQAESVPFEVIPVGGHEVNLYGAPDLQLDPALFPSSEYLEWWHEGDVLCAQRQTQVAVAKFGVRELWVPEHPDFKAWPLPKCKAGLPALAFSVQCCGNGVDPPSRVRRIRALNLGAAATAERHFGHCLVPVRAEPWLGRWAFADWQPQDWPEDSRGSLPSLRASIFTHHGSDPDQDARELCAISLRDARDRKLVARYAVASHAVYADGLSISLGPLGRDVRTSPFIDHCFHFRFSVGTDAARGSCSWLTADWPDTTDAAPGMATQAATTWTPVSSGADHATSGSVTKLYLFQENDTPRFHGGVVAAGRPVLTDVHYWLDEIELALARS